MRTTLFTILVLSALVLLQSCAATYKPINPARISYPTIANEIPFSYKHNVLKEAGNRKLAKKEDVRRVRIVAVKIENTTGKVLRYGMNYKLYSANGELTVLDIPAATASVKQTVPTYLLYLLLTPLRFNVQTDKSSSSTPIGLIVGPGIAAGNVAVAATANKRFREELQTFSLLDRDIKPGETFYGLIAIPDNGYMPLSLRLMN